jgi:hypothetical protein
MEGGGEANRSEFMFMQSCAATETGLPLPLGEGWG